ncbi:DUF6401 family natural product biosynthesis protein [Actinoplanes sp. L3-i22]|uniref:DUF6401 family natural product biosynthesis protein n=1 Tax=Actinoplanes sp. L3-i22 TaxID=2836373 RepID=UPI001C785DD6|nr:DUF6401 family natural product biosynthesis protein [Actinoplanes sp. L3-i22]BCY08063.1 hypothetical protein L3i22_031510 [Actinoplanes sp. L3-i22]
MELDLLDSACLALDQWAGRLGVPVDPPPGLVALADRHAARIRVAIGAVTPVNLAAYADGVADAAGARGWVPGPVVDWRVASWASVHLLAVCLMARGVC